MSRHPRTLSCLALVALGVAVACIGPEDAPRHAFRQIARALETRDPALFHEYVDVESVVATGLDAFLQRRYRQDEGLKEAGAFASGLVQATKPMLGLLVKARLDEAIAGPERPRRPWRGTILSVRQDGARTVTRVEVRTRRDEPVQLDVVLTPFHGHLRVVEVDLALLMDELEALPRRP
jgi:hypothetical protein